MQMRVSLSIYNTEIHIDICQTIQLFYLFNVIVIGSLVSLVEKVKEESTIVFFIHNESDFCHLAKLLLLILFIFETGSEPSSPCDIRRSSDSSNIHEENHQSPSKDI